MDNDPVIVLLIEDNPDHAEIIRRSFDGSRKDMRLVIAGSQLEAGKFLADCAPSVILCDYHLPDGTGLDILRQHTTVSRTTPPFVLLTSHGDENIAVEAMKAGATDYIVKSERSLTSLPDICRALTGGYRQRLEKERLERDRLRLFAELQANELALYNSKRRLEKSEQLLNRAQEMAHLGCWEFDAAANHLYWSDETYRIIGLEPQEIEASYQAFLEAVHPKDRALVTELFTASVRDGLDSYELEYRVIRSSGEIRFVHGKWDHLFNAQGKIERTVGIIHDITERKRMESSILESERRYRTLADSGQVLIWTCDTEKLCDYFNEPWLRFTGRSLEQELGFGWADGVHPEDLQRCLQIFTAFFDQRKKFSMEYRVLDASGGYRWIQDDGTPRFDSTGNFIGYIGHCLDITDRKRVEERIQQSEEKFSKAFNNAPVMISFTKLEDGTYLNVNRKFCELSGFSAEEVIGRTSLELRFITPEDRQRVVAELQEKGQISALELSLHAKNGKQITVLYHGEVLTVDGDQCLLSISVDISGHRHLEEQLRQSQKMEAIGQLAGGVAHDFNNILTVIMGYGNILEMDASLDAEGKEAVEQILSSSERAAQLTHGLLAFSRKQIMTVKICDLDDIVNRVRNFLVRTIGENIQFSALRQQANLHVCVDSGQIEQVLINLATNARDAMPSGGVLTIKTELQELDQEFVAIHGFGTIARYAVMTVSDNGQGMDKETQSRIFEPFYTTKKVGKGTGLGMAIVYGIVKQHKGFIYVYSEPGVGTTFRIYLPICEPQPASAEPAPAPDHPKGGGETVLVAEDEPSVRKLVETVLSRYGYRVITAVDGQDCVEQFAAHCSEIDLILMDMIMPKKNGMQVLEEIKLLRPEVKVLYSSGYASDFIKTSGVEAEDIEIIMKPVKPMELLRMVREILDR